MLLVMNLTALTGVFSAIKWRIAEEIAANLGCPQKAALHMKHWLTSLGSNGSKGCLAEEEAALSSGRFWTPVAVPGVSFVVSCPAVTVSAMVLL